MKLLHFYLVYTAKHQLGTQMKKEILLATGLAFAVLKSFSQNVGVGEPNPSSKFTVKGNLAIGSSYSQTVAPPNGAIIEGVVGIGTPSPNTNAILDLSGADKTIMLPRMTTAQRLSIASPQAGMFVYDINLQQIFWHDGTNWFSLSVTAGATGTTATREPQGLPELQGRKGHKVITAMTELTVWTGQTEYPERKE